MVDQTRTVSRNCYYNLRRLRLIRTSLSHQALRVSAYALVLSKLVYCNVLYAGVPHCLVKRIQILISTAARVLSGRPCFSLITDYVRDVLHWLQADQRIDLKVATIAFKGLNGLAPSYLINIAVPSALASRWKCLRSSSELILFIHRHNNKYAERAFAVAYPSSWNKLSLVVLESQ